MTSATPLYYKQNRLKQLRAFCQTARTGSVSLAAERLFLSQPSVSLQIKALERELGITLFERNGPQIKMTPEANILYDLAHPLVEGIDNLHETFAARYGKLESGTLDIAAGESTILYILGEPVRRFIAEYPGIDVKLHNVTGRDGLAMMRADQVDLAIGSMLELPDDINYQAIVTYGPTLITPKDHPLANRKDVRLEEISPYGLILPPRHLSTWRLVDLVFSQHNVPYHVSLEAGGWEIIKKYVELGMGISIVTSVCLTGKENLASIPLDNYFPKRSYGVVLRKNKFLSPQAQRFIDIMGECFKDSDIPESVKNIQKQNRGRGAMDE
ncbi:MAG: LysR family transcriptional regulator [Gammaproteobacteria bacterium]|nr:LysR family transcriptional regulator [Gammaproteobacteria bacterium]